ncbi:hypothetical protein F4824DRAFT_163220 [Ustulina deusta]|nr:hypothetical protein F4824DRAFT_163220 [Ustulina deusta]
MRAKVLGPIVACLVGFVGVALATSGGIVDSIVDSTVALQHIHLHDRVSAAVKHEVQHQERDAPQPPHGPVHRCHDPHPEIFGPAPPVEDCNNVIKWFAALTDDIDVKLVGGCLQRVSGNCTGLVCPHRLGESTIPGAVAAQYMASPVLDECIAKGQRGWWIDGQGWGVGVYLT